MKLSEFKEYIINKFGELMWEGIEDLSAYKIYIASEEKQKETVQKDGTCIKYINNPSEDIQLIAVRENGSTIQYIHNPSEKVQLEAVKENPFAIGYIKNPTDKVLQKTIKLMEYNKIPTWQYIDFFKHLENDL